MRGHLLTSYLVVGAILTACSGSGADAVQTPPATAVPTAPVAPVPADAGAPFSRPTPGFPVLKSLGGNVMASPVLVGLHQEDDPYRSELDAFVGMLPTSAWWQSFAPDYGLSTPVASVLDFALMSAGTYSFDDVRSFMDGLQSAPGSAFPLPNNNTVYMLWTPDGVVISDAPSNQKGCKSFYAIHFPWHKDGGADTVAVVPRCAWSDLDAGWTPLDHLSKHMSHEIAEAVSDPGYAFTDGGFASSAYVFRGSNTLPPWQQSIYSFSPTGGEIGDLCEASYIRERGYLLQRVWSTTAAAAAGDPCVPARSEPYINVAAAQDWYSAVPGERVLIPLTGWATGTTASWSVNPHPHYYPTARQLTATFTSDAGTDAAGKYLLNNGTTGTLELLIPATAQSGDVAIIDVHSFYYAWLWDPSFDTFHSQLVGVYIP